MHIKHQYRDYSKRCHYRVLFHIVIAIAIVTLLRLSRCDVNFEVCRYATYTIWRAKRRKNGKNRYVTNRIKLKFCWTKTFQHVNSPKANSSCDVDWRR